MLQFHPSSFTSFSPMNYAASLTSSSLRVEGQEEKKKILNLANAACDSLGLAGHGR